MSLEDYLDGLTIGHPVIGLYEKITSWQPDLPVTIWQSMGFPIIGFGKRTYKAGGSLKEWFIIGLAAHKKYNSLYIWGFSEEGYLLDHYKGDLGKVKYGKACLNFQLIEDLNLSVLRSVIKLAVEQAK